MLKTYSLINSKTLIVSLPRPSYRSKLYRDFRSLEARSVHSRIRFFESNEAAIRQLEEGEFFELLYAYSEALYRAGAYSKYKAVADEMIACCLERQPAKVSGEDVFLSTIFRKAVSCYYLAEYEQAGHLFKELLRLDPSNPGGRTGLRRTYYRTKSGKVLNARAASVLLLMAAALLTAVEMLVFRYFFPSWLKASEWIRIGLFAFGILVLAGSDLYQRRRAFLEAERFWKDMEKRKNNKREQAIKMESKN